MSGLVGKYLEIDYCTRVSCHDFEHLPSCHFRQGFFRSKNGQRTNEPAHVQFPVEKFIIRIHTVITSNRLISKLVNFIFL